MEITFQRIKKGNKVARTQVFNYSHTPVAQRLGSMIVNQEDWGSSLPVDISKFGQFRSHAYMCLSDETPKAIGPFYLVSMPGELEDLTQVINV